MNRKDEKMQNKKRGRDDLSCAIYSLVKLI